MNDVPPGAPMPADKTLAPGINSSYSRAMSRVAIVAGFFLTLCIGFLGGVFYCHNMKAERLDAASAAQVRADMLYDKKDFEGAVAQYDAIVQEYPDLGSHVAYAVAHAHMARAEQMLSKAQWDEADEQARLAAGKGAPADWVARFKGRFMREHDIAEKMVWAEYFQEMGQFDKAMTDLEELRLKYPDLQQDDAIKDMIRKTNNLAYRNLIDKGRKAYKDNRLEEAYEDFSGSGDLAEKLQDANLQKEARDYLAAVDKRMRLIKYYTVAEKAFAQAQYSEAAKYYKMCDEISTLEVFKTKYNKAMALDFLNQARVFKENGLPKEAATLYNKVLDYDPENAEAKQFLETAPRSGGM